MIDSIHHVYALRTPSAKVKVKVVGENVKSLTPMERQLCDGTKSSGRVPVLTNGNGVPSVGGNRLYNEIVQRG